MKRGMPKSPIPKTAAAVTDSVRHESDRLSSVTEEESSGENSDPDFWIKFSKTALIMLAFLCMGLMDIVRGPTLLDLRDLMGTSIARISYIFPSFSLGSMAGSCIAGILLDRFLHHRLLLLFGVLFLLAVTTALTPFAPDLWSLCTLAVAQGSVSGALDTGGNVLCLDLWKGRNSGPYMHSIHFSFSVGALLAPLMATPFLRTKADVPQSNLTGLETHKLEIIQNYSQDSNCTTFIVEEEAITLLDTGIDVLYPLLGLIIFLVSFGFLLCHFKEQQQKSIEYDNEDLDDVVAVRNRRDNMEEEEEKRTWSDKAVLALLSLFFFTYVGMLVTFGLLLTPFAVESRLGLSRQDGAEVTTVFFLALAAARAVSIVASVKLRAITIMTGSLLTCCAGSILLSFYADTSFLWLQIGSVLMGVGWSSMFATGLIWVGQYERVTNKVGSAFTVASSAGCDILPLLAGQLVARTPMALMYLQAGCVAMCVISFLAAVILAVRKKS